MNIFFKKLHPDAIAPTRVNHSDAGNDLYALGDGIICSQGYWLFKTGIGVEIPEGYYGQISPRSGLAYKHGIGVLGGIIDSAYRSDIGVILINHGRESYEVKVGDRIAQLIIKPCTLPKWIEVNELSNTSRAENGFGSSGR